MHELMNYVCDELEELEKKVSKDHKLSMSEIEYADKLAHLKKDILRADELMDAGYSGDTYRDGTMYNDGYSNRMYSMEGSYARGRGSNAKRDSMGRYSSDRSYPRYSRDNGFMSELHELKESAPNDQVRREVEQFIDRVQGKM